LSDPQAENPCQAGRTLTGRPGSIFAEPCPVPGRHRIVLTDQQKMPESIVWFCDEHFGYLRATTPMKLLEP